MHGKVLVLPLGQVDDQTVQRVGHRNLAAEAAGFRTVAIGAIQHRIFVRAHRLQLGEPGITDIDVAGCAREAAATLTDDARKIICLSNLQQSFASLGVKICCFPGMSNKSNFRHFWTQFPGSDVLPLWSDMA
jgi:hypothetical protein